MATTQDPFNVGGSNNNMTLQLQHQSQPQYPQQPPQQPFTGGQNQLVVATQQSNPYDMSGVAGAGVTQTSNQLNSSFVNPPPTTSSTASATSFDPFATPRPQQQQQQQSFPVPQQQYQSPAQAPAHTPPPSFPPPPPPSQDFMAVPSHPPPPHPPHHQQQYQRQSSQQFSTGPAPETQIVPAQPPSYQSNSYGNETRSFASAPPTTVVVRENDDDDHSNSTGNYHQPNNENPRNQYSNALALPVQGANCAGLPKAELVGKRGFVLSRISFRTIVMKKWKQSFWVQYGGHTMLWFRSQQDFDDWLNNPYHNQSQRNFLIKLAVNFVHDLYKPNVRGYQVTQSRTKPYGKDKVIRQFKLERWMDYGPTIAAAFGSYEPKEVDACRAAIVECMKNTPLDNGIRATGAVKEHHDRQQRAEEEQELQKLRQQNKPKQGGAGAGNAYQNYRLDDVGGPHAQSMVAAATPTVDLLGDNSGLIEQPRSSVATSPDLMYGNGAMVPSANPTAAYPGAPPPSNYNPSTQPTQQQAYPQQTQPSYGAPSPQGYSQYPQGYPQQPQPQGYPQPVQQY